MNKHLVLGQRDISVLYMLHLHPALTAKQLAELCFPSVGYETARKRLRRINQSGYMDISNIDHKEEKGRPEHIYFLNTKAAQALAANKNIAEKIIAVGPPNVKHYDYLQHLAEIHLVWQRTAKKAKLQNFDFITKRAKQCDEQADAFISYTDKNEQIKKIYLVLDTGNLRPTRHWIPKMTTLLNTKELILIVTTNKHRLDILRQWTLPLFEEAGIRKDCCVFTFYDEILKHGILTAAAYNTVGNTTPILE